MATVTATVRVIIFPRDPRQLCGPMVHPHTTSRGGAFQPRVPGRGRGCYPHAPCRPARGLLAWILFVWLENFLESYRICILLGFLLELNIEPATLLPPHCNSHLLTRQEVSGLVAFLCMPTASYISGLSATPGFTHHHFTSHF